MCFSVVVLRSVCGFRVPVKNVKIAALMLVVPCISEGQTQPASRYLAQPSGEDLALTERSLVTPHLRVGATLVAEYTHTLTRDVRAPSINHRITSHVSIAVGLFNRAQIALVLPVVLSQEQNAQRTSITPGDVRFDARVRLAGDVRRGSYRLALAITASFPTGDTQAFTTHDTVVVTPRVLFEATFARDFVFALNAGVALRTRQSHILLGRAGVSIPLLPRVVLTAEGAVESNLDDPSNSQSLAIEILGGVRHVSRTGVVLGIAAGPRATEASATADVRVVGTLGYAPQPPLESEGAGDRDLDNVLDPDDQCPDQPAGDRPDPEKRGCPIRDRDHDGFRDEVDVCPTQPPGDDPDTRRMGCPSDDRDHDGVSDTEDTCPIDPSGDHPDVHARGCPMRDGDSDGVADGDDVCPLEPAGRYPDATRRGCPDPDPDRDGFLNDRDACPEERGVASRIAAHNGCPRVRLTADRVVITVQPRFAVNRDVILAESVGLLTDVAAVLEAHPEIVRIEIQGHTDDVGNDALNLDLSRRRAESIRAWLAGHGISDTRLTARGFGEARPIADNHTTSGRQANRRVEFVVLERNSESNKEGER
jgi:OmpA-OmpF porin, OOP family